RLRVADVLHEVNRLLRGRRGYMVVAESGDMPFAGLDVRVERGGGYLAQGYYASMGFGVPGALGAQLGTGARPLVLSGDGAFQMTGPEIAQAPRFGLSPIVLVVNNGGWQIFRPVVARAELLDVPPWPYARLADDWGGRGFYVERVDELRAALAAAARLGSFVVVAALVRPDDLARAGRAGGGEAPARPGAHGAPRGRLEAGRARAPAPRLAARQGRRLPRPPQRRQGDRHRARAGARGGEGARRRPGAHRARRARRRARRLARSGHAPRPRRVERRPRPHAQRRARALLLHLGHDQGAEGGAPHARLHLRAPLHRRVLARPPAHGPPLDDLGHRLGQGGLRRPLRPVDERR